MSLPISSDTSYDDSRIRPYFVGPKQHDTTIASIVLFQNDIANDTSASPNNKNYLTDLSSSILPLIPEGSTSGVPQLSAGNIPLLSLDGKNAYYGVFNNFSLSSINEVHNQIVKVHMNFSARWNAFFLGSAPSVYQFTGMFLDYKDYPYYQEFMIAYDKYLSGRKCIENNMQTKLISEGQIMNGFLLDVSVMHTAANPSIKEFRFTMLVKDSYFVRYNIIAHKKYLPNGYDGVGNYIEEFNGLSNLHRLSDQHLSGMVSDSLTE